MGTSETWIRWLRRFGRDPQWSLVDESATTAGSSDVGAMNRSMTISTAIRQRPARAVVMAGMALQAKRRFTHGQQICVRRAMGVVARHAVFCYRWMLICKWAAILGMAAQTELVDVRRLQVIAGWSAMSIMAIHAAHLAFAKRVVVWHAHLRGLGRVTFKAGIICLRHGPDYRVGLRRYRTRSEGSTRGRIEVDPIFLRVLLRIGMNLVTVNTANMVRRVRSARPVLNLLVARMAAQANAVSIAIRAL